jgi:hypothetical protein
LLAGASQSQLPTKEFDVVCPWLRLGWLSPLLGGLPAMRVAEMLLPEDRRPALREWLVGVIAPMLRRDDRFHRLRRELRQALWFDPDLFRLALRTRWDDGPDGLRGSHLSEVWRRADHLRVVEKDAPGLLPLAYTLRERLVEWPAHKALQVLKAQLAVRGLGDAGWRYLIRHGARAVSDMGGGGLALDELAQLAQALAMVGKHPPPSAALQRAWRPRFAAISEVGPDSEDTVLSWLTAERHLAGAVLRAAGEARRMPGYAGFIDGVVATLWWLRDAKIAAPRKSLRTLARLAGEWEADQLAIAQTGMRRWSRPRSLPCHDGVHEAVLLDGPAMVLEEARAMRNCLRARIPALSARKEQVWSVRKKQTGQRVALVGLEWSEDRWARGEIAARFNRPAPAWVTAFAEALAVCENLRTEANGAKR